MPSSQVVRTLMHCSQLRVLTALFTQVKMPNKEKMLQGGGKDGSYEYSSLFLQEI